MRCDDGVNYLDVANICPHGLGLITCYLSSSEVLFYARYNYKLRYKIEVLEGAPCRRASCLSHVSFVHDSGLFVVSSFDFTFYVYDFVKLKLVYRLEKEMRFSYFSVQPKNVVKFRNENNALYLDLNKLF